MGYSKGHLMVITALPRQWDSAGVLKMESIKKSLLQLPIVKSATLTYDVPEREPAARIIFYPPGSSVNNQLNLPISSADEDYAKTFGIKMKAGSFFSNNKDGVVLNEAALKQLGISSANAVGQQLKTPVVAQPVTILGVMKDYNFSTLQDKIRPIGFIHVKNRPVYRYMAVKLNTGNMPQAINEIKSPLAVIMFQMRRSIIHFMDDKFAALYKADLQLQTAADIATMLNLIIVLLGIIGVVAFMLTRNAIKKLRCAKCSALIPAILFFFF